MPNRRPRWQFWDTATPGHCTPPANTSSITNLQANASEEMEVPDERGLDTAPFNGLIALEIRRERLWKTDAIGDPVLSLGRFIKAGDDIRVQFVD